MTLDEFTAECRRLASADPRARNWRWTFSQEDFQREWHVTVSEPDVRASMIVHSASATAATPGEVVEEMRHRLEAERLQYLDRAINGLVESLAPGEQIYRPAALQQLTAHGLTMEQAVSALEAAVADGRLRRSSESHYAKGEMARD